MEGEENPEICCTHLLTKLKPICLNVLTGVELKNKATTISMLYTFAFYSEVS